MSDLADRTFHRYMSVAEAEAVRETGLLRGGRPGRTYWTTDLYLDARSAKSYLALRNEPEVRLAFRITNDPALERGGTEVAPDEDEPGGGTEYYMSEGIVEVEVIVVDSFE